MVSISSAPRSQATLFSVHSFYSYLLSTYCGPEKILGAEGRAANKSDETLVLGRNKIENETEVKKHCSHQRLE